MKRLIILFSMIGLLAIPQAVESQTNLVKDSVAMVDSLASADSIVADAMLVDDADIEVEEAEGGLHKQLKTKFIDGNVGFMSLVALALVLGLAFCIERIIYLTLSEIKAYKLMDDIENKLKEDDVE